MMQHEIIYPAGKHGNFRNRIILGFFTPAILLFSLLSSLSNSFSQVLNEDRGWIHINAWFAFLTTDKTVCTLPLQIIAGMNWASIILKLTFRYPLSFGFNDFHMRDWVKCQSLANTESVMPLRTSKTSTMLTPSTPRWASEFYRSPFIYC